MIPTIVVFHRYHEFHVDTLAKLVMNNSEFVREMKAFGKYATTIMMVPWANAGPLTARLVEEAFG
jgi:hypothetical protein